MIGRIYKKSLEHLVLPVGDKIEGGGFMHWLRKYRREQWLSETELQSLRNDRLSSLLSYSIAKIPFYKNIISSVDPFETISRFPIMTKSEINRNLNGLLVRPKESLIAEAGSGSSGIQGTVYMDKSAQASQRAIQMLWFEWSGYRAGDSVLQTGMTMRRGFIKALKDRLLATDYIPAFDLDRNAIEVILDRLRKKPRQYLFGYASSLYLLAQTALDANISNVRFKYAVSWGDKLFPHYRRKLLEAFGCKTLDTYGCTEGAMIGAECSFGNYHLSINQCYVEIVDDDGVGVSPGEMGKVLVTRLDNYAMPLIRYYLGDLAELESPNKLDCPCGRKLPILKKIIGRDTDIVRTRSGKQLIVHFFTGIFEHVPQIHQFMVVQTQLDHIEIQYIPGTDFREDVIRAVELKIHERMQEKFPIRWLETSRIANTKSGKPQIIQSFLKQSLHH